MNAMFLTTHGQRVLCNLHDELLISFLFPSINFKIQERDIGIPITIP
jgi:hypothetical protein